jgi:hypothetical protein
MIFASVMAQSLDLFPAKDARYPILRSRRAGGKYALSFMTVQLSQLSI